MASKLDMQTYMSEFESHWVPHSYGHELHLSEKLIKLRVLPLCRDAVDWAILVCFRLVRFLCLMIYLSKGY